jgi:hypothetical protein
MNTTRKVVLASACGAAIGYAVASQLLHGWLFVGIIIGAIAGWFLYDPARFFVSVKGVVCWAVDELGSSFPSVVGINWKGICKYSMRELILLLMVAQTLGTILLYVFTFIVFNMWMHDDGSTFGDKGVDVVVIVAASISYGIPLVVASILFCTNVLGLFLRNNRDCLDENSEASRMRCKYIKSEARLALRVNPVTFPFFAVNFLAKRTIWVIRMVPTVLRFFKLLTVMTFRLAHSNGRLASAVGGALGALVGLWAGYLIVALLVGAIAGGIAHYLGQFCSEEYVEKLKANLTSKRVRA